MFTKLRNKFLILNMSMTSTVMIAAFAVIYIISYNNLAQNFYKCVDNARKHIQNHIRKHGNKKDLVAEYGIPELKTFCKTLDNWLPYILNYYDYRISNGLTEGNNHKVKNIKRRGYGYRNDSNFNLRVKLEFECA